jgi:DNA polymerase-1
MTEGIDTLLIDADSLAWKAALSGQQSYGNDPEVALRSFVARLGAVTSVVPSAFPLLCYSYGRSYRKILYPKYKAHRPPCPQFVSQMRDTIIKLHGGLMFPSLEGDDVVGIHHVSPDRFPPDVPQHTAVFSEDKDLAQLPGWYIGKDLQLHYRSREEADRLFYLQVLTGDPADGYPGCPKVGKVKARVVTDGVSTDGLWDVVCLMYEKHGLTEQDAILQARLAWVCRWHPSGNFGFIPPKRKEAPLDWSKVK